MEFDNNGDTEDGAAEANKGGFIYKLIPLLTLMMIVICMVMLVLVVNLDKKVDGLEKSLQAFEDDSRAFEYEILDSYKTDSVEIDESEIVDIAEAAVLDNESVRTESLNNDSGIRRVYLTFDDGPSSNTDKILDILEQYGVKATFFVVGKENYAEQYKRIVEDGHTLGLHSYSHNYSEIYASIDAYKQDLTKLHDFLYELTGVDCNIVRFPGGSSNTISHVDMRDLAACLDEMDMVYFDWNVSSGDAASGSVSASQITQNVLNNIDKYNNVVILFHDAAGKGSTVDALPVIIEKILESEDTVMLPISEDTVPVQHLH